MLPAVRGSLRPSPIVASWHYALGIAPSFLIKSQGRFDQTFILIHSLVDNVRDVHFSKFIVDPEIDISPFDGKIVNAFAVPGFSLYQRVFPRHKR